MSSTERKLASIRKIDDINPIPGADAIEVATVDGWNVVVKKGEFFPGELVVYLEIDSWTPHEIAPFLSKGTEPRVYNGVKGERLKTIKLRGQVSQGLLLKTDILDDFGVRAENPENKNDVVWFGADDAQVSLAEGYDLTDFIGVQKWEAKIPAQLRGRAKGNFPTQIIPKTDQDRVQNVFKKIQLRDATTEIKQRWNDELNVLETFIAPVPGAFSKHTYEVTMKLDGSSMTIFRLDGVLRVCSRNLELEINDENATNTFVKMAMEIGDNIPEGFAFQGELMGEGIQGNREGFKGHRFFVFDVFNIKSFKYLDSVARLKKTRECNLEHVPIIAMSWEAPESVASALELAEGPSINHKIREGLVWKCKQDPSFSFKAIANNFLLKGGN